MWGRGGDTHEQVAPSAYYGDLGVVFYGGDTLGTASSRPGRMDSNLRDRSRDTELHKAVDDRNLPVVKIMVQRGASLTARGSDGKTPYERAMAHGFIEIAQYLYDEMELAKQNPFEQQQ